MTGGKIALIIGGVVALGVAGYFGNEELTCQNLEDDYLNSVSSQQGFAAIAAVVDDDEAIERMRDREEQAFADAELALTQLYIDCGERRARNVAREGHNLLLGI